MSVKLNTNAFINKANLVHGNKFEYSEVEYVKSNNKVKIICPIHGVFEQTPNNHLNGRGCPICSSMSRVLKQSSNTNEFVTKAKIVHGDKFNYSKVEYTTNKKVVTLICNKHGDFKIKPNDHLTGGGCPRCSGRGKTNEDFVKESKIVHGDKYNYLMIDYLGTHNKVKIICPIHGVFEQTPNHHLSGAGCPICKESRGESNIRKYLEKFGVRYVKQYRFKDCRDIRPLPFDFYLPDYNMCIEYQGEQHFKPVNYFGGVNKFNTLIKRDLIKKLYCENNNINLLLVNYLDNIELKLKENVHK